MPQQVGSRRSLIVSLILTIAIAFGALATTVSLGWGPRLGLDLAGGLSVVYKPATKASLSDMNEVVTILTNRVDGLGVSGATVNLQGKDVNVSVPGVTDAREVLAAVGETAQLLFRPVLCEVQAASTGTKLKYVAPAKLPTCGAQYLETAANVNALTPDPALSDIKPTTPAQDYKNDEVMLPILGEKGLYYVLGKTVLTGRAVHSAVAQQGPTGAWVVNDTFTKTGSPQWDTVADASFHKQLAIELDGVVQSAPVIQPGQSTFTSFDGSSQISGQFTESSAKTLALALEFGALPVRLTPLDTVAVSPTLGHSALVAGLAAGLAGLALVLLYTILYYRALGLVIVLGLSVTAALLWAIISALGHTAFAPTFDLSGVTGLIVSIGITVDSYVVYFERLKDEARAGRSIRSSVDRGFRSAWRTVLAADTVSLLAAVLLYIIAVGDVKGFAFFLGLSTLMDIFITWYFTRPLVILLGRRDATGTSKLSMAAGLHAGSQQLAGALSE
ncbi:MAG: protein translocase subunit SecD [Acidimicrobiales bacterium]